MDPSKGIDINTCNGFRVNGKTLATEDFIKWFDDNKAALCQVTSIGGPAPIHPTALATFSTMKDGGLTAGGFSTSEKVAKPIVGKIFDLLLGKSSLFMSILSPLRTSIRTPVTFV
jgi:xylose isomerase